MDRRGAEKSREMMLEELLGYDRITIQCHDNPDADAIASGFGLYCFFRDQGKDVRLLYAGKNKVRKANLTLMVEKLGIPLKYLAHPGAGGRTSDHSGLSIRCRQCDRNPGRGDRSDRSSSSGSDLYGENAITT